MSPNGAWQLAARAVAASANSLEELRHGSWASVRQQITSRTRAVLLGESSHGTEEFYRLRAEVTKYLIEVRKFQVVIVEADWPLMWHVNQYIHRKKATMWPTDRKLTDQSRWLWRNKPKWKI